MSQDKATPRPWVISTTKVDGTAIKSSDGAPIALVYRELGRHQPEAQGNAELIVRAVNCHEQLVAALSDLLGGYQTLAFRQGIDPTVAAAATKAARIALAAASPKDTGE